MPYHMKRQLLPHYQLYIWLFLTEYSCAFSHYNKSMSLLIIMNLFNKIYVDTSVASELFLCFYTHRRSKGVLLSKLEPVTKEKLHKVNMRQIEVLKEALIIIPSATEKQKAQ